MSEPFQDEADDQPGFLRRWGWAIAVAAVVFGGATFVLVKVGGSHSKSVRKPQEFQMVKVQLPPPPPPPPPPPQPPPPPTEQKMIEQVPVDQDEPKPDNNKPAPAPNLGTGIKGDGGPDAFGLSVGGSGDFLGGGSGNRGSGSRWGWYAAQIQAKISDALSRNSLTRVASFNLEVRVWADVAGRIMKARLARSTGRADLDRAIEDDVLVGLQLAEPPPKGMPMPVVLRMVARRPN